VPGGRKSDVQIIAGVSRTFNEYLLLPNRTSTECCVQNVDLATPLVRHRLGETPAIELLAPFTSAIMQAVTSPELAIALARVGGIGFLHHNQSTEAQADAVREVKSFKAGFVVSDTNVRPNDTLRYLVEVMRRTGHSTAAVTEDGSATGRLCGPGLLTRLSPSAARSRQFGEQPDEADARPTHCRG
jgi:IMP dehydrogenase